MTVIFSDNSSSLAECWADKARETWPAAKYFTDPVADAYDIEQLHRDVATLPRLLAMLERRETEWREPRSWSPQELFDAMADPAAFVARYFLSVSEARDTLNRLEAVLGRDGAIHDCTSGSAQPVPTLTLAALRMRIDEIASASTIVAHRASGKGRRAA